MSIPTTTPPRADELIAAVARLPQPAAARAAAVHLALPATVAVGIAVRTTSTGWRYREQHLPTSHDPYTDAAALAAAGHRDGDTYLDLTADPIHWVKTIRSGWRHVAFGTDTLFGTPLIILDENLPPAVAGLFAHHLRTDRDLNSPTILTLAGRTVLAEAGTRSWELLSPDTCGGTEVLPLGTSDDLRSTVDVNTCGTVLGVRIGALAFDVETVTDPRTDVVAVRYTLDLPNLWQAQIPAELTSQSELVGVPIRHVAPASPQPVPDGWSWRGRHIYDHHGVAEHRESGILALLYRTGQP